MIDVAAEVTKAFPRLWCDHCGAIKPMVFDVMKAKDMHDAADIMCADCFCIAVTLHAEGDGI